MYYFIYFFFFLSYFSKIQSFKKITFKIGGHSARTFGKQGYNIKIKNNENLYGRSHLRLRADASEATFIRSKLTCDIHNRLGLPSISANYATLYINDEYMGFYILLDVPKLSWAKSVFHGNDNDILYQCSNKGNFLTYDSFSLSCTNENDNAIDNSEWINFLKTLDKAENPSDIEDIFDIDLFLTEIAIEYLIGSFDHFLINGHNYYIYKPQNDKWKLVLYDFDLTFGQDIDLYFLIKIFVDIPEQLQSVNREYYNYSFDEWARHTHLVDILILKDPSRFEKILKDVVSKAFNPTVLYPRIDELKSFIKSYVEKDKTPNEKGNYPGKLNLLANDYTLEQWDANSEFTSIETSLKYRAFGLKYWILQKYRYVCKTYSIQCDNQYIDESFQYPIDKNVEMYDYNIQKNSDNEKETTEIKSPDEPSTTTTFKDEPTPTVIDNYQCFAEMIGYSCCSPENKVVYAHDNNGDWGYDFNKQEWCGLTPYIKHDETESCWSEKLGYPCCSDCYVFEVDTDGSWGYNFSKKQWCGVPKHCPL